MDDQRKAQRQSGMSLDTSRADDPQQRGSSANTIPILFTSTFFHKSGGVRMEVPKACSMPTCPLIYKLLLLEKRYKLPLQERGILLPHLPISFQAVYTTCTMRERAHGCKVVRVTSPGGVSSTSNGRHGWHLHWLRTILHFLFLLQHRAQWVQQQKTTHTLQRVDSQALRQVLKLRKLCIHFPAL